MKSSIFNLFCEYLCIMYVQKKIVYNGLKWIFDKPIIPSIWQSPFNLLDQEEESKKAEWKAAAKKELEDWYKLREETLAKTHAKHKLVVVCTL